MTSDRDFHGPNLAYILELYERFRDDPDSVDEAARQLSKLDAGISCRASARTASELVPLSGATDLAQAIVRAATWLPAWTRRQPARCRPVPEPGSLQPGWDELRKLPRRQWQGENAFAAIESLRSIYCRAIGYDYNHIRIPAERDWLYSAAESGRFRAPVDETKLLERLTQVEAFELFLHRLYPGKTRFSVEGLEMLIPMLDEIVGAAAGEDICAILIGMAHRGRLNVLAHVLQKPYAQILAEFNDPQGRATTWDELGWTGDVKYHMGGYKSPKEGQRADLVIRVPANPIWAGESGHPRHGARCRQACDSLGRHGSENASLLS
jgi:2-oxoglutarate dehydrogenase E1 component